MDSILAKPSTDADKKLNSLFSGWMCADSFGSHAAVGTPARDGRGSEEAAVYCECDLFASCQRQMKEELMHLLRLAQMGCCDFLPPACQQQGFIQILDFASTWILLSETSVVWESSCLS